MKIAFVVRRYPAFSETFITRQIIGLIRRGHDVDIYAFRGDPTEKVHDVVREMRLLDRVHYVRDVPRGRFARSLGALRILCRPRFVYRRLALNVWRYGRGALASRIHWLDSGPRNGGYDIIHCQFADSGVAAAWWRKAALISGKLVTTFQGLDVVCEPRRYRNNGYELLFREGDHFTGNSGFTVERAVALGCPRDRITVWPNGLDISKYEFRRRTMPVAGPIRLLTVCRLAKIKGLEYSIRAFARLAKDRSHIEYRIVGDGIDRAVFERLIEELGLQDRIKLLGWKTEEQLQAVYRGAHLFILPSITSADGQQEAQGVVLQEAQASGLPVVATRTGGIPESIVEGKSGFLVPEKNPEALAERIGWLLDHSEVWNEMGRAGRQYVESKFEIGVLTDRLIAIYNSLLDDNAP